MQIMLTRMPPQSAKNSASLSVLDVAADPQCSETSNKKPESTTQLQYQRPDPKPPPSEDFTL